MSGWRRVFARLLFLLSSGLGLCLGQGCSSRSVLYFLLSLLSLEFGPVGIEGSLFRKALLQDVVREGGFGLGLPAYLFLLRWRSCDAVRVGAMKGSGRRGVLVQIEDSAGRGRSLMKWARGM